MAEFVAIEKGILVNGPTIMSLVNGMGKFKEMGQEILEDSGIEDVKEDGWYSQQAWLDAFKDIADEIGESTLFNIGKAILENAQFPPEIDDIHKGLSAIDVAYHMNHKKGDNVMFNPQTGEMLEGIGHYKYEKVDDKKAKLVCDTPYPCEFDRGIVTSMARKFEPMAEAVLDTSVKNKKDGEDISTYIVTW